MFSLSKAKLSTITSAVIIAALMILATTLITVNYLHSRAGLIEQVEKSALLMSEAVDSGIVQITDPVVKTVQMLELDPIVQATSYQERLARLPVMLRALEINPLLSAIYVGYPDGDFFLLRRLTTAETNLTASLNLPVNAFYLLQAIDRSASGNTVSWVALDEAGSSLKEVTPEQYEFDPRSRPWFQRAVTSNQVISTQPYVFFTTQELGLTFASANQASGSVIGADAALGDLSAVLLGLRPTSALQLALVDEFGNAIAATDAEHLVQDSPSGDLRIANIAQLGNGALLRAIELPARALNRFQLQNGASWFGANVMVGQGSQAWQLVFAISERNLFSEVYARLWQQLILSLVVLVLLLLASGWLGRKLSMPISQLCEHVNALADMDFSRSNPVKSQILEVQQLADGVAKMTQAIGDFQAISQHLAQAPNQTSTLDHIVQHIASIAGATGRAIYLYDNEQQQLTLATETNLGLPNVWLVAQQSIEQHCRIIEGKIADNDHRYAVPLIDYNDHLLGILILKFNFQQNQASRGFVKAVASTAAVAISTRKQIDAQQKLLDSLIKLLADAIDAKSPYTGGHCERVPELANMLLQAAIDSDSQQFADFDMTPQQRREFQTAAWLHDCGKVTSPEHVVDKATKLETLYNRIHEIRTRFEVLWRDAEIECLQGMLAGGEHSALLAKKSAQQQALQNEFEAVASANIGGEFLSDEAIALLEQISQRKWVRHFDDTLGLSRDEQSRRGAATTLPAVEELLADKVHHLVPWGARKPAVEKGHPRNKLGFDMELPANHFNFGELHNLKIRRGTLTDEERFIVNDHIIQTIRMLSALPLPDDLARVPDIAGNHHERMDGKGYPRRLSAEQLSIPERIMAIADVFEALTAHDRPYKAAKTLSEAMNILAFMAGDGHIDPELFALFVTSGTYVHYCQQFLHESQIDDIDVEHLMQTAGIATASKQLA